MNRSVPAAVLAGAAVLALGGCAGTAAGGPTSTAPAEPAAIATWSSPAGIAPELVYVTDVEGFVLAPQSVGVMGDDGMSAMYVREDGAALRTVLLTTSRDVDPSVVVPCSDLPDRADAALRCSVERGDAAVTLEGEDVDPAVLRAAAAAVRVPRADELDRLFAEVPVAGPPVERGDLPQEGDGAPIDPPVPGG